MSPTARKSSLTRKLTAVLLAAGSARRFGANKLLAPMDDGSPMAVVSARHLIEGGCRVLAVLAAEQDALAARLLELQGVRVTVCPDAEGGIGNSLAWGVARSRHAGGWLVALGDMPFLDPATIRALAGQLRCGASIVAPEYEGQRGHPVGFSALWREDLLRLRGDVGARRIVEANPQRLAILACGDPGVVRDVDRQADLEG